MNCGHCGRKLGFLERWRFQQFCSQTCKENSERELPAEQPVEDRAAAEPSAVEALPDRTFALKRGARPGAAEAPPPDPPEARFVAAPDPGSHSKPFDIVGFHRAAPSARKDRKSGGQTVVFSEGRIPSRVALEHEARRLRKALRIPSRHEAPTVVDSYYWSEILALFCAELIHHMEFQPRLAPLVWEVPAEDPCDEPAAAHSFAQEWPEAPPQIAAAPAPVQNAGFRFQDLDSLEECLTSIAAATPGWQVVSVETVQLPGEASVPRLSVTLAPIQIRGEAPEPQAVEAEPVEAPMAAESAPAAHQPRVEPAQEPAAPGKPVLPKGPNVAQPSRPVSPAAEIPVSPPAKSAPPPHGAVARPAAAAPMPLQDSAGPAMSWGTLSKSLGVALPDSLTQPEARRFAASGHGGGAGGDTPEGAHPFLSKVQMFGTWVQLIPNPADLLPAAPPEARPGGRLLMAIAPQAEWLSAIEVFPPHAGLAPSTCWEPAEMTALPEPGVREVAFGPRGGVLEAMEAAAAVPAVPGSGLSIHSDAALGEAAEGAAPEVVALESRVRLRAPNPRALPWKRRLQVRAASYGRHALGWQPRRPAVTLSAAPMPCAYLTIPGAASRARLGERAA